MLVDFVPPHLSLDSEVIHPPAHRPSPSDFVTPVSSPRPASFLYDMPLSNTLTASPVSLGRRRLDAFHIQCLIGKGGFGKVFMVRHKATAQIYAMKVMEKHLLIQRKAVQDAHAERNILAMVGQLQSHFIVRLHIAFQTSKRVYLVMDFASGGELMFHLRREAMLNESDAKFYAAELLIALETLHDMHIVHRDIKPENVLLDGSGHLILTDFGLAKELDGLSEQTHSWCGSEDYMAPEIVARASHAGKPADYWAYGVFIYDCLCGQPPFSPLHEKGKLTRKRLHDRILKCKYKLPAYLSRECHSLLRRLLTKDPSKRLTDPAEIRAHPWFHGLDWDAIREKQVTPPILPSQGSPTACFSPSLTKQNHSAPQSPVCLTSAAGTASSPIPMVGINNSSQTPDMWQGFSFVAPGMEVHFELAPSATAKPASLTGSESVMPFPAELGRVSQSDDMSDTHEDDIEDPLVAELAEFSLDAAEAVEIDGDDV